MRFILLISFLLLFSMESFSQAPFLAVNRVDKRTSEVIRQTSMYSFKDAGNVTKLNFSVRAVDDDYFLLLNVPVAATIKKGTVISLLMEDGKRLKLISNNDIISLGESDISKRMMVCDLDPGQEMKELMKQAVKSISIPTSNKGNIEFSLIPKDKGLIRSSLTLVQRK